MVLGYALGAKNEDEAYATFYPRMPGNSTLKPGEKVWILAAIVVGLTAFDLHPQFWGLNILGISVGFYL